MPVDMCRWLGYFGDPLRLDELIYNTTHSLIEQSRAARFTSHLTNADGFGLGWYGSEERPGVYRSVSPAWSDCHPFRRGRWLLVHNGFIDQYMRLRCCSSSR